MRTIAIVNQKGGCGKTITAINLAAFLARSRRRVLVVDMDPQGHATLGLLSGPAQPTGTMADVFLSRTGHQRVRLRDIICRAYQNLEIAPADILLSAVPEALAGTPGREDILSLALAEMERSHDYVIVDCPPSVGLLTFNALKACSEAIVPMDPSFFSLHGIGKLLETFDVLAREAGHEITPRVLVTLYLGRSPFVKAVLDEIRNHLPGRYFETVIRHSLKLSEAASHGVPIVDYCRHCAGYDDYQLLATEVLRSEEGTVEESVALSEEPQAALRRRITDSLEPYIHRASAPKASAESLNGTGNSKATTPASADETAIVESAIPEANAILKVEELAIESDRVVEAEEATSRDGRIVQIEAPVTESSRILKALAEFDAEQERMAATRSAGAHD